MTPSARSRKKCLAVSTAARTLATSPRIRSSHPLRGGSSPTQLGPLTAGGTSTVDASRTRSSSRCADTVDVQLHWHREGDRAQRHDLEGRTAPDADDLSAGLQAHGRPVVESDQALEVLHEALTLGVAGELERGHGDSRNGSSAARSSSETRRGRPASTSNGTSTVAAAA